MPATETVYMYTCTYIYIHTLTLSRLQGCSFQVSESQSFSVGHGIYIYIYIYIYTHTHARARACRAVLLKYLNLNLLALATEIPAGTSKMNNKEPMLRVYLVDTVSEHAPVHVCVCMCIQKEPHQQKKVYLVGAVSEGEKMCIFQYMLCVSVYVFSGATFEARSPYLESV
jgi:hypothetical protein